MVQMALSCHDPDQLAAHVFSLLDVTWLSPLVQLGSCTLQALLRDYWVLAQASCHVVVVAEGVKIDVEWLEHLAAYLLAPVYPLAAAVLLVSLLA